MSLNQLIALTLPQVSDMKSMGALSQCKLEKIYTEHDCIWQYAKRPQKQYDFPMKTDV